MTEEGDVDQGLWSRVLCGQDKYELLWVSKRERETEEIRNIN